MRFDRVAKPSTKAQQVSRTAIFPAPSRGWIRNERIVNPKSAGGAEVLDNIFPTPEGGRMRKGSQQQAIVDGAATYLATYTSGTQRRLFACKLETITDVTSPDAPDEVAPADVSGQSSGDYSSVQVTTPGGTFLLMFNGSDPHQVYNGSAWAQNTPAIAGVSSANVSFAWAWKSFVWMIEDGTTDAWYLPAGTIGGTAVVFPLGGVFRLGGSLLFGVTYSQDSGAGLDDYIAFVSTEGEIALYQGTDPASINTFALVGVYRVGRPLGKNAWARVGGDVWLLTDDGVIQMSSVASKDRAGLIKSALSFPIEEAWRQIVRERAGTSYPFTAALWPSSTMLVVGIPTFSSLAPICLVMNTRTGAWGRYTGWDTRCVAVLDDKLFFGTAGGKIMQGEVTGADGGQPYSAIWIPRFETFKSPQEKMALSARFNGRANKTFTPQLFCCSDYEVNVPAALSPDTDDDANAWDTGTWGVSVWGELPTQKGRISQWQTVDGVGQSLTVGVQIPSGRVTAPDLEMIAIYLQYEVGEVMG